MTKKPPRPMWTPPEEWMPPPAPPGNQQPELKDLAQYISAPEAGPIPKSDPATSLTSWRHLQRAIRIYAERMGEALPLFLALPAAEPFYASRAWHRLIVGSNRSGKTLHTAVEIARVLTGKDPYKKCPTRDGRMIAVGVDESHIGDVMWHKLAAPGAFRIIKDPETGVWRSVTFDPAQPNRLRAYDEANKHEWRLSPPLIPPRLIVDIAWKIKKQSIPASVTFKSGWEAMFFSSLAKPKRGIDVDFGWFDEEIGNEAWYPEMVARLLDREGIFVWDGTPQKGTEQFYELQERCRSGNPDYAEFHIKIADNPFISERRKEQWQTTFIDEEERQVRYEGINVYAGLRVYPEFNVEGMHGIRSFTIPRDWSLFMTLDPGSQVTGVLFTALRPDGKQIHAWKELFLKHHDAAQTAAAIKAVLGDRMCDAFIIDMRAGRQTPMAQGQRIHERYSEEFEAIDLRSVATDSGFFEGDDNIESRTVALKMWLRTNPDTKEPFLVVHRGMCPNLVREMKLQRFNKKRTNEREKVADSHIVHCLEYTAAHNPQPVLREFDLTTTVDTTIGQAWLEKLDRLAKKGGDQRPVISLGPNSTMRRTG